MRQTSHVPTTPGTPAMRRGWTALAAVLLVVALLLPTAAEAAFPGENGELAFVQGGELLVADRNGQNAERLFDDENRRSRPSYSADGSRIMFLRDSHLWTASASGDGDEIVARVHSADDRVYRLLYGPTWAPEGTRIAFVRVHDTGIGLRSRSDVYDDLLVVLDLRTGEERTLLETGILTDLSWSPDGTRLAYGTGRGIWTVPASGGVPEELTRPEGVYDRDSEPDWSPDGRRIAFTRYRSGDGGGQSAVWVMNADGSDPRQVSGPYGEQPVWSPDGTQIVFTRYGRQAELMRIDPNATFPARTERPLRPGSDASWRPIDTRPPRVIMSAPTDRATLVQGTSVSSAYSCDDPPPGSGVITACEGSVPSGQLIDTASPGDKSFTVRARDRMGNEAVVTHRYTVAAESDLDGVPDSRDNCPTVPNADQADGDRDGIGDACDPAPPPLQDIDRDGLPDTRDNCRDVANPDQADGDGDGLGDACDPVPPPPPADRDLDGVLDASDNCVAEPNQGQADADADAIGDACDESPVVLPPVDGVRVAVRVLPGSGPVFVRYPAGRRPRVARVAQAAPPGFVPLAGAMNVPVGATIDARSGAIALTSAARGRGRQTRTGTLTRGMFQIAQQRSNAARAVRTDLVLRGPAYAAACRAKGVPVPVPGRPTLARLAAARKTTVVRTVTASLPSGFRVLARQARAVPRGRASFTTSARCDGTFVAVRTGRVAVEDLQRGRTRLVRAGQELRVPLRTTRSRQ